MANSALSFLEEDEKSTASKAVDFLDSEDTPKAHAFLDEPDTKPSLAEKAIDALKFNHKPTPLNSAGQKIYPPTSTAGAFLKGIPGTLADIASPGTSLEEVKGKAKDLLAAAVYEAGGAVKGASLGYVNPILPRLEKTSLKDANIFKPAAVGAGEFVGAMAPISAISKGVGLTLGASGLLKGVAPVLQTLVHSGVTGALYGASEKPEGKESQLTQRFHNALNDAAGFIVLTGAGQLVDKAATALASRNPAGMEDYQRFRKSVIDAFVSKGASPEQATQMADIGIDASVQHGGGWGKVTKGDLLKAEEAIKKGQKIAFGEAGIKEPVEPQQMKQILGPEGGKSTSNKASTPSVPSSSLNPETLGPKAHAYIKERFPVLSEALADKSLPLAPEELHSSLTKATAVGEEVLLRGGTPEEANLATLRAFSAEAQPLVSRNALRGTMESKPEIPQQIIPESTPEAPALPQNDVQVPERLVQARDAANQVLKTNKLDKDVLVKIVDQIAVDDVAFKKGYGKEFKPSEMEVQGATYSPGARDRVKSVIELANGANEGVGRHEAFHAVSNILLDEAENKILTDRFGGMEGAADAFAEYRATGQAETPVLKRIFEKMKQFLERVQNYFKEGKFKTADDLLKDIEEGKLKGSNASESEPQYKVHEDISKDLKENAIRDFGTTEDFEKAGFVLPDGRMIDFTAGGKDRIRMHSDIESAYKGTGNTGDLPSFLRDTNAVRLSQYDDIGGKHVSIEAHGPLTQDQLKQIGEYYDTHPMDVSTFEVVNDIGKPVRHKSVANPTSEDVSRFFNGTSQYKAVEKAPTFYSKMEKTLEEKMPVRAMPDQIKGILTSGGVKQDEVDWSGINDWLKDKKGSVTKEEVLNFVKENNVQVQEVMKGSPGEKTLDLEKLNPKERQRYDQLQKEAYSTGEGLTGKKEEEFNSLLDKAFGYSKEVGPTKFDKYTLPGGKNYRELLLTLPESRPSGKFLEEKIEYDPNMKIGNWSIESPSGPAIGGFNSKQEALKKAYSLWTSKENFASSHFSEPNILSHIRFNDRIDSEGKKVLFLEEIQSDWHQKGRTQGYVRGGGLTPAEEKELESLVIRDNTPEERIRHEELTKKARPTGVPNAPFKKTWQELSLKRMLRYAAENGYDKIAWTTGEQQAERYDLSKQIKDVNYVKVNDKYGERYEVWATDNNGHHVSLGTKTAEELPGIIGKQAADKIIQGDGEDYFKLHPKAVGISGTKTLSGIDLKVGGEGMKGFYDKIVPEFLNKYTKKWGGRVGESNIKIPKPGFYPMNEKVNSLDITPSMKESVLTEGQPQYKAVPKNSFSKDLDDLVNGDLDSSAMLKLGKTPAVFKALGAKDLPIEMSQKVANKVLFDKHDLPIEELKKLPEKIADPIMVFESATQPGRLVVLTEMQSEGKPVVAAIALSVQHGRNEVNAIASVHQKDSLGSFQKWLDEGRLRYRNTEKTKAWFSTSSGLQLPTDRTTPLKGGFQSRGLYLPKEGTTPSGKRVLTEFDLVNPPTQYKSVDKRLYGNQEPGESVKEVTGLNEGEFKPSEWQKFLRNWYDRMQPIKYAKGKEIAPLFAQAGGKYTKSYVMARELPGKIRGISESMLNELNRDLTPLKTYEDRLLLNRIYSLRNYADLDRIGKTTNGVTAEQAQADLEYVKEKIGQKKFDTISGVADKLANIQNNKALQMLVDAKVITPQAMEILTKRYPNYLRSEMMDEFISHRYPDFKSADNGEPIGKINKSFLKEKQGTKQTINEDVLDVIRRSLITKVSAAQKQIVIDQIAKDFGKEIGGELFKDGKIIKEVDPSKIPQGWIPSPVKSSGGKIFAVNSEVANLLEGLNTKEADFITKSMANYNRYFRMGATTLRVPFMFNNIFRDVQTAIFNKRNIPGQTSQVGAYAKGALESLKQMLGIPSQVYENFIKAGGAYGGQVSSVMKGVDIPSRLTSTKEQIKSGLAKAVTLPIEVISSLAEFSENTSRLAEWLRVQKTNLPDELKALQPRDLTVDFEKSGDMMKKVNQIVPFLNANAQGTVNNLRLLRDQPGLGLLRTLAYVVLPTVALYEYNKRFKNNSQVDPYIKNNYWDINTGIEATVGGQKLPLLLTIRKGEYAQTVSYFVQMLLEKANKDPNFDQKLKDFTMQGGIDSFVSTLVPPLARVPIEEAANRNFFTGRPIISQSLEKVEPKYQFKPGTTNTARRIGEKTGIPPVRLEHVATGLFPASGQVLEASDKLLKPNPKIKREDRSLFPFQSLVPMVRTPTGFFSQEEAAARDFENKKAVEKRTPNFLFENAYRQYLSNKTQENEDTMRQYAAEMNVQNRKRIIKKINREEGMKSASEETRAIRKLPKSLRKEYMRGRK